MRRNLITRQGFNLLREELDTLWRKERPAVTEKVSWAASLGDRSENADYQYNKRRLREIDRRVRYLVKRMEELEVIDSLPARRDKVYFGARVVVEKEDGERKAFRILGYDEALGLKDAISVDSPMARALLQKQVGDEICVSTPKGKIIWHLLEILYE